MVLKKGPSKFACDSALFKPEPPIAPRLVKALFQGREKELRRGLEILKGQLDIDGKRSRSFDKGPWVIHGESRSGKSHLARRIFAELPDTDKRIQLIIPAREKIEALLVMANLFRQMVGHFRRLTPDLDQQPDVRLADQVIAKMDLFLDQAQTATVTAEQGNRRGIEVGGEVSGLLGKLLGKYQSEQTGKNTRQVVLKPPTATTLAEVCGVIVETLLRRKLVRHVLILVDDLDLLEGYQPAQQNARVQRSFLAEALCELHAQPGIDVVLTARSWYANSTTEFHTLVNLGLSEMSAADLIAIHDRHMKLYAKGTGIDRFLTLQALQTFAGEINGLPGVFLQHLQTAFYEYQNEDAWGERNYDWFLGIFRRLFADYRSRCALAADMIEKAVQSGRLEIDVGEKNPIYGTVFDNQLAFQSYYNEKCYLISSIVKKILTLPEPLPAATEEDQQS